MELLVSKKIEATSGILRLSQRLKMCLLLLLFGILGLVGCAFTMINTGGSAEKIQEMGFNRVANSLENVLSIMAIPVLLFMILLVAYACQQIYKEYRSVYNPKNYGRSRKRPVS
jgi:TRAP-type C4-dicarboxylate transport system permease small subunit